MDRFDQADKNTDFLLVVHFVPPSGPRNPSVRVDGWAEDARL